MISDDYATPATAATTASFPAAEASTRHASSAMEEQGVSTKKNDSAATFASLEFPAPPPIPPRRGSSNRSGGGRRVEEESSRL